MHLTSSIGRCQQVSPSRLQSRRPDSRHVGESTLLLYQPLLSCDVAKVQELNICTVRDTWLHGLQDGMASLYDTQRSGAPHKLDQSALSTAWCNGSAKNPDGDLNSAAPSR